MDILTAILVYVFVFIIAITPFFLLYLISDLLVVYENLRKSFPDRSEGKIKRLVRLSYRNLSDVMVETLKGFSLTKRNVLKRHRFINPEILGLK